MERCLGRYAAEEIGKGRRGDYGGIAEVFKFLEPWLAK